MGERDSHPGGTRKHVRVPFPAQVEFAGEKFRIEEFTANVSEGGIFLSTERRVAPGTRGTLTFRLSQWDRPFTVQAEVVRSSPPTDEQIASPGLGLRFLDLEPLDRERLRRLVDGVRDGSVVQAIRRAIREGGGTLLQELRRRPADQKVILALHARGEEFEALIRDGNPAVLERLLVNPRLTVPRLRTILRHTAVPPRVLLQVHRQRKWMEDEELRFLFCRHPRSPRREVMELLPRLERRRLQQLQTDPTLHPQVRDKVKSLLKGV